MCDLPHWGAAEEKSMLFCFCNTNAPVSYGVRVMVFNATFNNISVVLWQSVLLVEETRVPGENHWPVVCYWQTLSHSVV